jgi:hypothetical protein
MRTTPVRSEAGEFVMEMWIEEGKAKRELQDFESSADPHDLNIHYSSSKIDIFVVVLDGLEQQHGFG